MKLWLRNLVNVIKNDKKEVTWEEEREDTRRRGDERGRMEMDGRRESSTVRRDNVNISCFFSRTRAPKTKN